MKPTCRVQLPLRSEKLRGTPKAWVPVKHGHRDPNQGSFRDGEAIDLDSFFAHPLEPRCGGNQALRLRNNLVQVM